MEIPGKVVVVTGGGSGIGQALCVAFAQAGAEAVVAADLDEAAAARTAAMVEGGAAAGANAGGPAGTQAEAVDVGDEASMKALVERVSARFGRIDIFCSNAGIIVRGDQDQPVADWQRIWEINVLAHVHAANAVLPQMLERGEGYLVQTASAAGLLSQVDSAAYSTTKHAAVGFAEWLSIAYHDRGIRVSCLCPQGVLTPMLVEAYGEDQGFLAATALSAEQVAADVLTAIASETFLILPHPEVQTFLQRKVADPDRWLAGMRRLRSQVLAGEQPGLKG